jgi:dienelactone hydrolase
VRVESGSRKAEANIERAWLAPGVTLTVVDDAGVQGVFARPAGDGPFAGVVAFGGSGGGLGPSGQWAALLASRGIATLAISFFGVAGVPAELVGIEVEVVERAIAWLRHRPEVHGRV